MEAKYTAKVCEAIELLNGAVRALEKARRTLRLTDLDSVIHDVHAAKQTLELVLAVTPDLPTCCVCAAPTAGSVGAAGLRWRAICQACKDKEDERYETVVGNFARAHNYETEML